MSGAGTVGPDFDAQLRALASGLETPSGDGSLGVWLRGLVDADDPEEALRQQMAGVVSAAKAYHEDRFGDVELLLSGQDGEGQVYAALHVVLMLVGLLTRRLPMSETGALDELIAGLTQPR